MARSSTLPLIANPWDQNESPVSWVDSKPMRQWIQHAIASAEMESLHRTSYDLTIRLDDKPGSLAALGELLGDAGINIDGICGVPCEGGALLHILVQDPATTRQVLEPAGFNVTGEQKVLLLNVIDRPGELGGIARRLADAKLNINLLYLTASMDLVIGVDPIEQAAILLKR